MEEFVKINRKNGSVLVISVPELIEKYNSGMSLAKLGREYDYRYDGLRKILVENGVIIRDEQDAVEKKIKYLMDTEGLQRYLNGEAALSISKSLGIDSTCILRYLKKHNVPIRNFAECHDSHRCSIDHNAFDIITEDAAYFGGYLFADGAITKSKYADEIQISLNLSVKDRAMVERFQKFLKTDYAINDNHSVKNGKISYMCRLGFQSKRIGAVLGSWGVNDEKSNRGPTEIIAHNKDFVRGLLDGDGCLYINEPRNIYRIILVGNIPTLEVFKNFVEKDLNQKATNIAKTHSDKCWQVHVNGKYAKEVCKALWGNATICLERKMILAQRIIDHDLTRKYGVKSTEPVSIDEGI